MIPVPEWNHRRSALQSPDRPDRLDRPDHHYCRPRNPHRRRVVPQCWKSSLDLLVHWTSAVSRLLEQEEWAPRLPLPRRQMLSHALWMPMEGPRQPLPPQE